MSFLDNCGTIVLDAILTDLGRKRMSQGNFHVKKFALGDDEIDYKLFQKASIGEGYTNDDSHNTDRPILSQSCFEALNNSSAVIDYGLTSFERNDLLYLPTLKINYSGSLSAGMPEEHSGFARPYQGVYYLSANQETTTKLKTALNKTNYILESNNVTNTKVVIEGGIDSADLTANSMNRETFIVRPGLLDLYYNIYADSRFFNEILVPDPSSSEFKNKLNGNLVSNFTTLSFAHRISLETILDKFDVYLAQGIHNHVYNQSQGRSDHYASTIKGPRGSALALGFMVTNDLGGGSSGSRSTKYAIFGKTDQTVFGGSDKYDYIDSTIYVVGTTSGGAIEVPLRIIRYAGT